MADFADVIEHVIQIEGGYRVWNTAGDRGGRTCAGISERANPRWPGWRLLDEGADPSEPQMMTTIHALYRDNYWAPIKGHLIEDDAIATAMMSCAVLSGPKTAARLMQLAVGEDQDGIVGTRTLQGINLGDAGKTLAAFTLARIARYAAICNNDRSQSKFLLGWLNRALGEGAG